MGYRTTKSKIKVESNKTNNYTEFFYKVFRNILIISIPLIIISALVLSISRSSAEDGSDITASDSFTVSISSSCTISSEVENAHVININAGSYTSELGSTKVNAYCNDNNGYSIYAIGSSNNVDSNTDLVSNINDNYNISTGLYNSSAITPSSPSTWSMKLTAGTGTGINPDTNASVVLTPPTIVNGFNNYSLVPSTYTLVASRSSATNLSSNTDVTGSYFTTTYDIYASSYQPAGTYSGKVKYVMMHPYDNVFIADLETAFASAGKEKIYYDQSGSGPHYAMQDMTASICNSVSEDGEITAAQLVDIRDNKLYWATKLKDGHCWMTQNLDLDLISDTTAENYVALTSENTNLKSYGSNGYNVANGYSCSNQSTINCSTNGGEIITWLPERDTIAFNNLSSTTWANDYANPYSYDGGAEQSSANIDKHRSIGNYYNWSAAIASNNSSSYNDQSASTKVAPNSICPKGWRLPDLNNYEFSNLLYNYDITRDATNTAGYKQGGAGFSRMVTSPLWFVQSGRIFYGDIQGLGEDGYYWSNTVFSSSYFAYSLYFNSSNIYPAYNANNGSERSFGFSIRCIAE